MKRTEPIVVPAAAHGVQPASSKSRPAFGCPAFRTLAAGLAALLVSACGDATPPGDARSDGSATPSPAEVIEEVVASEELIIGLQPNLKGLKGGILENLPLEESAADLFEGPFRATAFAASAAPESTDRIERITTEIASYGPPDAGAAGEAATLTRASLWPPAHDGLAFRHAKFAIVRGSIIGDSLDRFECEIAFEGHAQSPPAEAGAAARVVAIESSHRVVWQALDEAKRKWRIREWHPLRARVSTVASSGPLFEDARQEAFPDPALLDRVTTSLHRKILMENYFGGKPASLPPGYSDSRFYPDSVNTHDALSVVDIDGDGWDDLYVCVRWGKNLFLRNRGDGTFEEIAGRLGLDIDGRNTSATFADFDNDGDQDLLLGRSLERSVYLENRDGRFVPRPDAAPEGGFPFLVTSTSTADFNNDGLLDVFLCTYSPLDINTRTAGAEQAASLAPEWARRFLRPDQAEEVVRRNAGSHSYLGQVGPPNMLLVNRGGRFENAPGSEVLAGWRNSFQASWADYDNDGDQDLYVANDFSPDTFFRNDGPDGFSDLTTESGFDRIGFAMGAGWGDYDNDGDLDLYVSNMFSKAGRRITSGIPGLDDRFRAIAAGNYLYRQDPAPTEIHPRFALVSGTEPPAIPVARAGWAWGGQFADFDNDGWLDLYVSSGFYTAPQEVANEVDL